MPKVLPQYTDDAKRRIVLAGMEVMAESGYEKITIDDVAKKIGVTKGAIYWYFQNKNTLIQEILATTENQLYELASDPYFNRPDIRELPHEFDRMCFNEGNRRALLSEIDMSVNPDNSIPEVTPVFIQELVSILEKGIEREQKTGNIGSLADPNISALALAVLYSGLQRGDLFAILFLAHSQLRRTWVYAMKLFLNPKSLTT